MREIKFRAWNKEQKVMVYDDEDHSAGWWDVARCSNLAMLNARLSDSAYEMMQYTGMTDKNKKEIYEGDICEFRSFNCRRVGAVIFNEEKYRYELLQSGDTDWSLEIHEVFDHEVIGNIHDNPELMEV